MTNGRKIIGRSATYEDSDEFSEAVFGRDGAVIPLSAQRYRATLTTVRVGGLLLVQASVPSQVRRGGGVPGEALLLSPEATDLAIHAGHLARRHEIALIGERAEQDSFFPRPTTWAMLHFERGGLTRLCDTWRSPRPRAGQNSYMRAAEQDYATLFALLEATIKRAMGSAEVSGSAESAPAMQEEIEAAVARTLVGRETWLEQPRVIGARLRITRGVDEYLCANPGRPIYGADLCAALGVSPRSLHAAFRAVYGCSPFTFLKRRRLVMAHRALKAAEGNLMVKSVALDHGFWHLGNFSRDYYEMFGEHPSHTQRTPARPAKDTGRETS
jgi:AraC-like DNA-binding protein